MNAVGQRINRTLQIGAERVYSVGSWGQTSSEDHMSIPQNLEMLPKSGVGAFVERLARAHSVDYVRSRLEDWSEAVTRAAGDDVRLDRTEKLLVELKKKNLIDGRQAARLLTNHMREVKDVRSVQGLRNGRISSQH